MVEFVFLGDSLTYGFPYEPRDSWANLAAEKLGVSFKNLGVCGDTVLDMKIRFKREKELCKTLVLLGGTNDVYANRSLQEILQDVEEIITWAKERGVQKIILGNPLPVLEEQWAVRRLYILGRKYAELAKKLQINYLNFYEPFNKELEENPGLLIDGIHPSKEGYRLMAEIFLEFLGIENDF
ncbi:GDSL-type esterase/lipase family protein [Carboxydothermus pertinax]|uniref:Lipase/acylhydrolase n=1 Tax=Carboxydothermus pertinax TaxID=870242 RepID=A0A1L8CWU7_9THEO|nr:GDSL-type esterase/lipase family protein [Carboxydothermus pertinax]GAV23380.1 lipase/acylhydrolase [Carboxydothermus pertinax]